MGLRLPLVLGLLVAGAAAAQAQPAANASFNPRAVELFERDWLIMQWGVRLFDSNRDGVLSLAEAQPAARAFRDIADGDRDGRVTTYEYDRAREFIAARY